uniref:Uncharacterized protein n=1 Tax=Arundo donax TaxID=35708 RepID=A0A0A9DT39_ARUDO
MIRWRENFASVDESNSVIHSSCPSIEYLSRKALNMTATNIFTISSASLFMFNLVSNSRSK